MIDWEHTQSSYHNQPVADDELLARFAVDKKDFRRENNTPRPDAFFPPPDEETSVYRMNFLTDEEVDDAARFVASKRNRTVKARIEILAGRIRQITYDGIALDVIPSDPPFCHADIVRITSEIARRTQVCQQLAANFHRLHRYV